MSKAKMAITAAVALGAAAVVLSKDTEDVDVQKLIDDAKPGDTVKLPAGVVKVKAHNAKSAVYGTSTAFVSGAPRKTAANFTAAITIDKQITLEGAKGDKPTIIVVEDSYTSGIEIFARGVIVRDVVVTWRRYYEHVYSKLNVAAANRDERAALMRAANHYPPLNKNSAHKGTADRGYNTTVNTGYLCDFARNGSQATADQTSGGYAPAFPDPSGATRATWGTWHGFVIGNNVAGVMVADSILGGSGVTQLHNVCVVGSMYNGFEMGLIGTPDGDRSDKFSGPSAVDVEIIACTAYDNFSSGLSRARYHKLRIENFFSDGTGHYDNDNSVDREYVNDPGYGISSSRMSPQGQTILKKSKFVRNARKGYDAHHFYDEQVSDSLFSGNQWGAQIAAEEAHRDPKISNPSTAVFTSCEFDSKYIAFDADNGQFKQSRNFAVELRNCSFTGNVGFKQIYGNTYVKVLQGRFIAANPAVATTAGYNQSMSYAAWIGSVSPGSRGVAINPVVTGAVVASSYSFAYGVAFLAMKAAHVSVTVEKNACSVDASRFDDAGFPSKQDSFIEINGASYGTLTKAPTPDEVKQLVSAEADAELKQRTDRGAEIAAALPAAAILTSNYKGRGLDHLLLTKAGQPYYVAEAPKVAVSDLNPLGLIYVRKPLAGEEQSLTRESFLTLLRKHGLSPTTSVNFDVSKTTHFVFETPGPDWRMRCFAAVEGAVNESST